MRNFSPVGILLGLALLIFLSIPVEAQKRKASNVDCNKGDSINDALSKLDPLEANDLNVSGTCNENVTILRFEDLRLIASPGAAINAAVPNGDVVRILFSRNVFIQGFSISGPASASSGIALTRSHACVLGGNTISGPFNGIQLFSSSANINDNTINGIVRNGFFITAHSEANLIANTVDNTGFPVTGPSNGLHVEGNSAVDFRPGFIVGAAVLRGFGRGTFVGPGSVLNIIGNTTAAAPQTIIENNFLMGVYGTNGGQTQISNFVQIQNNGNPDPYGGGVLVERGANVALGGNVTVSNNTGQGVILLHNSSASFGGATVSNNSRNGVVAVNSSTIEFNSGTSVNGNTAQDIFCDSQSIIARSTNIIGATKITCPNLKAGKSDPLPIF